MTRIWTDGGCRFNPGPMAIAYVIEWDDVNGTSRILHGERWGEEGTNNRAELGAIAAALNEAYNHCLDNIVLYTDSALAHKLITGEAVAHNAELIPLVDEIISYRNFMNVEYIHIPREENEKADKVVKGVLYP